MANKDICNACYKPDLGSQSENIEQNPKKYFKAGIILLKQNKTGEAFLAFKQALKIKPEEPMFLSYFGLCLAMIDKSAVDAVVLCEKAAKEGFFHPELFINLGKVYLIKHDRKKAFMAFKKGLSVDGKNSDLQNELKKMGIRKQPIFPSLGRNNAINCLAGKVLSKLGIR